MSSFNHHLLNLFYDSVDVNNNFRASCLVRTLERLDLRSSYSENTAYTTMMHFSSIVANHFSALVTARD